MGNLVNVWWIILNDSALGLWLHVGQGHGKRD